MFRETPKGSLVSFCSIHVVVEHTLYTHLYLDAVLRCHGYTDDQLTALAWLLCGVVALRNVFLAVVHGQCTCMLT